MAFHDFENAQQFSWWLMRIIQQCLEITSKNRQGGTELVRHICNEIAAYFLHLPQLCHITEQDHCSLQFRCIVTQRDSAHLHFPPLTRSPRHLDRLALRLLSPNCFGDKTIDRSMPDHLKKWRPEFSILHPKRAP